MPRHVILLTDAHEAPAYELIEALRLAGVQTLIEGLREVEAEAALVRRRENESTTDQLQEAPLAVLYEVFAGADTVERFLAHRDNHLATPLHALPALAGELGLGAIHIKDEGFRLGLGSFKALGGAYAVMHLVLEAAGKQLGRSVDIAELSSPEVKAIAAVMTFACATDGNHGRSVAQGAGLVGARSVIFVHSGVSNERVAAIARFGAEMVRVAGDYDQSVREAARVAAERGWTVVSDTSWPGYERIPGLVMQGYTVIVREALERLAQPPTHIFLQAG